MATKDQLDVIIDRVISKVFWRIVVTVVTFLIGMRLVDWLLK